MKLKFHYVKGENMKVEKGKRYRVVSKRGDHWVADMDKWKGKIVTIEALSAGGNGVYILGDTECWSWRHHDFIELKGNERVDEIYTKEMMDKMGVDRVLYNGAATIVWLKDGRKGVAVQSSEDHPDRNVGFAMAYAYAMGTDGNKSQFKKNVAKMQKHNGYKK